ncbi:MAG: hypothetical protein BAJALOKI2v1_40076 [Promethearchaeota archaeon]|nr:MAG: hypothetical protein BAJALOKI2v1_40076 [Candidatus Lokiarchaeota archaeon]
MVSKMKNKENEEMTNIPSTPKGLKEDISLEKIMDNLNPKKVEKMFSELKVDDAITDAFYKSVESFFEMGFELARNLNIELISDYLKDFNGDKKK